MAARPFSRCLCLLVCLWAGRGAPAGADPLPLSGEVRLALSPEAASFLPIDIGALAERSCDPLPPPVRDGMAKCHLMASNSGGSTTAAKGVVGGGLTTIMASYLDLESSEGVETSCGIWDVTLTLDPDFSQPASAITFEENSEDPGRGVFSGVMEMSTLLHLANRDTGEAVDFPLRLGLGMAGPWVSAPSDVSPDPLLLFADRLNGKVVFSDACIPVWVMEFPDPLTNLVAHGCQICLIPGFPESSGGPEGDGE